MKPRSWLALALAWFGLSLQALPRNLVVVEIFSSVTCGACPGAAMGAQDLLANGHPVAIVKYQLDTVFRNVYSQSRQSYYSISGTPIALFDGLNRTVGGSGTTSLYPNYSAKVDARIPIPAHYTISAVGDSALGQYSLQVLVAKPEEDANTGVVLHAAVTESSIPYVWFNQTSVENVVRLMVPDQYGTPVSLAVGEQAVIPLSFSLDAAWQAQNCELVLWLQNTATKEILQSVKYSFTKLFCPPLPPQNLQIEVVDGDVIATWDAVTEDAGGNQIVPDHYLVLYSDDPDAQEYQVLAETAGLSAVDPGAASLYGIRFYKVVAVK